MRLIKLASLVLLGMWQTDALAKPSLQYAVSADQTLYDKQHQQVTFIGHVIATRIDSTIQGDKLILTLNPDNTVQRLLCEGTPARYRMRLTRAPHQLYGEAKQITYDLNKQQTWFEGDAHVTRGNHHMAGPYLTYQLRQNTLVAKGSARNKTHLLLQPNDVEGSS